MTMQSRAVRAGLLQLLLIIALSGCWATTAIAPAGAPKANTAMRGCDSARWGPHPTASSGRVRCSGASISVGAVDGLGQPVRERHVLQCKPLASPPSDAAFGTQSKNRVGADNASFLSDAHW